MDEKRGLDDFFLNNKPVEILVQLGRQETDNYPSALAYNADVTYSHTVKCLKKMGRHGLVEFEKKGRKKEVSLTEEGEQMAEEFYNVLKMITDQGDEDEGK